MGEAVVLVNILGAAALLLWGLRMVSSGMSRAFGAPLRRFINGGADNRLMSLGMGTVVTIALQSSTATCLMSASFVGRGLMGVDMAQAVMLGANVGTSLVVKFLTFDVGPLSAILVLSGVVLFRSGGGGHRRPLAKALIGLGLMLLSLHLLDVASEPLRNSAQLRQVLHDLDGAWLVGVVLAALLALLAHSSVASILLILPLAAKGDFGAAFGFALVLGANLGSALSPVLETGDQKPTFRRVPLGNLLVRAVGCVVVLPFLDHLSGFVATLGGDLVSQLVAFHVAFNLALALVFLPLTTPMAALLARLRPDVPEAEDGRQPRYLDDSALDSPAVAIGLAARETLRIGDQVEAMLRQCLDMLSGKAAKGSDIGKMDDVVDSLHQAVKLYVARLTNDDLDEDERRRANDIMTFAINLEHMGDIIDRNLRDLAEKKAKRHLSFSQEGMADIAALFTQTLDNLRMALTVFMTGDVRMARQLVAEKAEIRILERNAAEAHLSRVGSGRRESIETSALHLDILRDLKRINAHIASVAYPILENRGELEETRLRITPA